MMDKIRPRDQPQSVSKCHLEFAKHWNFCIDVEYNFKECLRDSGKLQKMILNFRKRKNNTQGMNYGQESAARLAAKCKQMSLRVH